jgi:hypothetical protein
LTEAGASGTGTRVARGVDIQASYSARNFTAFVVTVVACDIGRLVASILFLFFTPGPSKRAANIGGGPVALKKDSGAVGLNSGIMICSAGT